MTDVHAVAVKGPTFGVGSYKENATQVGDAAGPACLLQGILSPWPSWLVHHAAHGGAAHIGRIVGAI